MAGENENTQTSFSKEYVETLRQENADWRRKFQAERATNQALEVGTELQRRGIKAEANWVERPEGLTVTQAVDAFIAKHPHLAPSATPAAPGATGDVTKVVGGPAPAVMPKPEGAGAGAGAAAPQGTAIPLESVRAINEIKNDPKARAQMSAHYRELLRNNGIATPPDA